MSLNASQRFYTGNSQGGIMGAVYLAASTDVVQGVLGVGGAPYALLLPRSTDFGALFDPLTANTLVAESDGRVYSMSGTGSASVVAGNWLSNGVGVGSGLFGSGNTSASAAHAGTLAPGSTVMVGGAGVQTQRFGNFPVTAAYDSLNDDVPRVPLCVTSTAGAFLGQGRGIYIARDTTSRTTALASPAS